MDQRDSVKAARTLPEEGQVLPFAAGFEGQLIRPGGEEYDEARAVWKGMIDRFPTLIPRCAGPEDVIA